MPLHSPMPQPASYGSDFPPLWKLGRKDWRFRWECSAGTSASYELRLLFAYKYPLRFKNVEARSGSQTISYLLR